MKWLRNLWNKIDPYSPDNIIESIKNDPNFQKWEEESKASDEKWKQNYIAQMYPVNTEYVWYCEELDEIEVRHESPLNTYGQFLIIPKIVRPNNFLFYSSEYPENFDWGSESVRAYKYEYIGEL